MQSTPRGGENRASKLYGVLVTYRRPADLRSTLERVDSQTRPMDRLIVIDNGSSPDAESAVTEVRKSVAEYVNAGSNLGPAGGISLGMRLVLDFAADNDWIVVFDDDDPPYFDHALERLHVFADRMREEDPRTGGIGMTGGRFDLRRGLVVRIGDGELSGPVLVDHIAGGFLPCYLVGMVREVGTPLSELFFGLDDLEYGLRVRRAGWSLYADGEQWRLMRDDKRKRGLLGPETIGTGPGRAGRSAQMTPPTWRRYYSLRNLIYILREFNAPRTAARVSLTRGILKPMANLVRAPKLAMANLRLNTRALWDGWRGRLGMTVPPESLDNGAGPTADGGGEPS